MSEPAALEAHRRAHVGRVNAVIDYIEAHLDDDLTVEGLANVAMFSPFHFHRVFTSVTGETLGQFIGRLRIERAATDLVRRPERPVTEIALAAGFSSPSSFSRAFRERYAMTPTEWRSGGYEQVTRTRDPLVNTAMFGYGVERTGLDAETGRSIWVVRAGSLGSTTVRIESPEPVEVAYVRYTGRYQGMSDVFHLLFTRLLTWAAPRGFVQTGTPVYSVYHDNPSITDDDRLRVTLCVPVPADTPPKGEIGRMRLSGGPTAVATFELGEQDYPEAWCALFCGWLPASGYEPDDRLPYERWFVGREAAAVGVDIVDICVPVRPLQD